jgi:hypothetical protein
MVSKDRRTHHDGCAPLQSFRSLNPGEPSPLLLEALPLNLHTNRIIGMRMKRWGFAIGLLAGALVAHAWAQAAAPLPVLTDQALLAAAQTTYTEDDGWRLVGQHVPLGQYHGQVVSAWYMCGGACPDNTIRVISYQLPQGVSCPSVQGIWTSVEMGPGIPDQTLCVPQILRQTNHYEAGPVDRRR